MTQSVQVVVVALAALLVGVLIPVLMTMRSTMRRVEQTVEGLQGRLARVLDQSSGVLENVDHITGELRHGSSSVRTFTEALDGFAESVNKMNKSVRLASAIGASVGPAIAAGVRAYRARSEPPGAEAGPSDVESGEARAGGLHADLADQEMRQARGSDDPGAPATSRASTAGCAAGETRPRNGG